MEHPGDVGKPIPMKRTFEETFLQQNVESSESLGKKSKTDPISSQNSGPASLLHSHDTCNLNQSFTSGSIGTDNTLFESSSSRDSSREQTTSKDDLNVSTGSENSKSSPSKSPTKPQASPSKEAKIERQDTKSKEREAEAKSKREKQEEERMKMQVLVSNFTEEQLNRYEMFRRAAFPKASVRRLMQGQSGCSIAQNVIIAMSGIAKVYVGEIVETALDVMEKWKETGPIQPKHIREAVRIMKGNDAIPNTKYKKKLFRS